MSKRKGRKKDKGLSKMERRILEMARGLVKDTGYDPDQDYGGLCLTLVALRPVKVDDQVCFIEHKAHRFASEAHEKDQPGIALLTARTLAKAMASGAEEMQGRVEAEGVEDMVEKVVDLPPGTTKEQAREMFEAEIAKRNGQIQ